MSRRKHDFYETAPWQVDALVDNLPELKGTIWCPTVGDGSLLRRLQYRLGTKISPTLTNDIDHKHEADLHLDATDWDSWATFLDMANTPDWIVDNVPFGVAYPIAEIAYEYARKGVVLMTRISFVEGTKQRGEWLATHPRIKQIALERYSFTGNGKSDSATTEWLVWAKPGVEIKNPGGVTTYGYRPRGRKP
jgi:hypothetical protein